MPIFTADIPLSLYIHLPWCVRKCPYCDFNSHEVKAELPEAAYVATLLQELDDSAVYIQDRPIVSIFFGGGTPSLFSAQAIGSILDGVTKRLKLGSNIEITMEANPGTIEQARFKDFYLAGINRLSLGVQSLQDDKLFTLGRIHNSEQAKKAITIAQQAGFKNFNIDLMYGLPNQSIDDALYDLQTALAFTPTHLSWYQLTIEPNTIFYKNTPTLPSDDLIWDMQVAGQQLLKESHFMQYEVSAYARVEKKCIHNLNYWEFGDYLGIGAGAHSKITDKSTDQIIRFSQAKQPKDYLNAHKKNTRPQIIDADNRIFEFMLNALRLTDGFQKKLFAERTGVSFTQIEPIMMTAKKRGLLNESDTHFYPTALGQRFLNDLIKLFLPR